MVLLSFDLYNKELCDGLPTSQSYLAYNSGFQPVGYGPPVGHKSILQLATEHFGLKKSYLHFFFLEITCFRPEKLFQSNSRLMKIWVKFLSNTLRLEPRKK